VKAAPRIGLDARKARDFGIGTYTREFIAALALLEATRDLEFVVFAREDDRELFSRLPRNFSIATSDYPGYSLSELVGFPRAVRRHRLDLFHAFHYVLPPFLATPSVVTVHDLIHLHPRVAPKPWAASYAIAMLRSSVSRALAVIAVSESTRRDLEERFPSARGKIEAIPQGVSERFQPIEPESEAVVRRKYGLPASYALFLGGRRPHKNLSRVLEAFAGARRSAPELDLQLVLAGPQPDGLEPVLRSAGIADSVTVPGIVAEGDLPALYSRARLFLYPTLAEGFGLPALEAMASGTPVISSAIPVWRETCGDAALLVDPDDARGIAEAVVRIWRSEEERGRLRALGLRRAAEFPWRRTAERTLHTYLRVLR
jgi:alpha-1,3-rhamnosyl/mannosyltransferase